MDERIPQLETLIPKLIELHNKAELEEAEYRKLKISTGRELQEAKNLYLAITGNHYKESNSTASDGRNAEAI